MSKNTITRFMSIEMKIEGTTRKYSLNLNASATSVLERKNITNISIRAKDEDDYRRSSTDKKLVSKEALMAAHLTLSQKQSELVKDLPAELLIYNPDKCDCIEFDAFAECGIDLSASFIQFNHEAANNLLGQEKDRVIELLIYYK